MFCDDVVNSVEADPAEQQSVGGVDRIRGECAAKRHTPGVIHSGGDGIAGEDMADAGHQTVGGSDCLRAEGTSAKECTAGRHARCNNQFDGHSVARCYYMLYAMLYVMLHVMLFAMLYAILYAMLYIML